jgi:hypothetical protein
MSAAASNSARSAPSLQRADAPCCMAYAGELRNRLASVSKKSKGRRLWESHRIALGRIGLSPNIRTSYRCSTGLRRRRVLSTARERDHPADGTVIRTIIDQGQIARDARRLPTQSDLVLANRRICLAPTNEIAEMRRAQGARPSARSNCHNGSPRTLMPGRKPMTRCDPTRFVNWWNLASTRRRPRLSIHRPNSTRPASRISRPNKSNGCLIRHFPKRSGNAAHGV